MSGGADDEAPSRRIDKWLWCARRFKTRSLAAKFVSNGGVRVTRDGATHRIEKASFPLRISDRVAYLIGERLIVLTVTGFADRRGSPAAAKSLFAEGEILQEEDCAAPLASCKAQG